MRRGLILAGIALATMGVSSAANAAKVVTVSAMGNSSSGGAGLDTGIALTLGDFLTTTVSFSDLWSAGGLPRWSNANGLTGNLAATGSDESGLPAGTLIGTDFGLYTQSGFTAPYGALVGKIGNTYKLLGTSFSGPAWDSGNLVLFYWDSNNGDNSGSVDVTVAAVPEPATWALMLGGFAMAGFALRRRNRSTVRTTVRFG